MKHAVSIRCAGVLLLSLPVLGHAELPDTRPTTEDFLGAMPIVLTPSRLSQPLNRAPAAVTVIDRELIEATGYRDIPRLLRLVPGMQVGQERGSSHWVTYHGMGNDNPSWIQVLIDGRSVYSPGNFDGIDWTGLAITMDEIERIEVVRGTNSAAYGSNAFLGVINIITRDFADQARSKLELRAGHKAILDGNLLLERELGAGGIRLNAEIKSDEGYSELHDGRRFKVLTLSGDHRLSNHDEFFLRLSTSAGVRELGYPDSIFDNNSERTADSQSSAFHLRWRHAPSPDSEWQLHYYRNQDRSEEEWTASAPAFGIAAVPLDRNRRTTRDDIELQHHASFASDWHAVWGLEMRRDKIDAPFLYFGNAEQTLNLMRLFGLAEWQFRPEWSLSFNALAEKFDDDAPHFSPRLFANWQASPDDTIRFLISNDRQPGSYGEPC